MGLNLSSIFDLESKGLIFLKDGEGLKFKIVIKCSWEERVKFQLILNGVKFIINILLGIKGVNFSLEGEGLNLKFVINCSGKERVKLPLIFNGVKFIINI